MLAVLCNKTPRRTVLVICGLRLHKKPQNLNTNQCLQPKRLNQYEKSSKFTYNSVVERITLNIVNIITVLGILTTFHTSHGFKYQTTAACLQQ